ncbi:MAG: protein translocase subunit SecD [Coriobacteriia bacterium]|nr:protein translocase subunit SecD [Coriobacteriia bacterium]
MAQEKDTLRQFAAEGRKQQRNAGNTAYSGSTKKKKKSSSDRRNVWLLVLTTLLVVGAIFLFMPPQEKITQGLDIQGGLSVTLTTSDTSGEGTVSQENMEKSRSIVENRVNALGAAETSVSVQGTNQILVQIPGMSDAEEALRIIGQTGKLEFARLDSFTDQNVVQQIESGNYGTEGTVTDSYGNTLPSGKTQHLKVEEGTYTDIVTGENIELVTVDRASETSTDYAVNLRLDSAGAAAFHQASKDLLPTHGKIVIILDGEVQSAPAIQGEIPNGQVQITGNYTQTEAQQLQTILESGSLPVSFTVSQSQVVGPTLGQEALFAGLIAALLGLALVMLYLLFFYRGLGLIAAAAMGVFAVLYLGILAGLSALGLFSLSLAGIAGIVLTIGMAADSSVLTLERFREEIRMGRSVKGASITGVWHAIQTSIDADLVSLVSALCLFFLASASVKGFGMTLALGILCDIVMMLIFKAPLIRLMAPRIITKNPGLWDIKDGQIAAEKYSVLAAAQGQITDATMSGMMINAKESLRVAVARSGDIGQKAWDAVEGLKGRFIKHDFNILGYRKYFLTVSAVLVVLCFVVLGVRGLNFGIEFVGGTSVTISNTGDLTTEQLRSAYADAGEPDAVIQTTETNGEQGFLVRTATTSAEEAAATSNDVADALGLNKEDIQVDTIGPDWGASVVQSSLIALLVSFLLIILYIAIRFRDYRMGVIAIVALLHDLIIVVGIYALVGREMNPNTIAALLTILGYSLYDTVVVFHRINDNMDNLDIRCSFMTMANHSVNQVLVRSINTTLTSLVPVVAMLFFGGETLKDFAFAMVIGLIIGAYSSIGVASPLYSIWKSRSEENQRLIKRYGPEVGNFAFKNAPNMSAQNAAIAAKGVSDAVEREAEKVPVEVATGEAEAAAAEDAAEKQGMGAKNQSKAKSNKGRNKSKKKRKY